MSQQGSNAGYQLVRNQLPNVLVFDSGVGGLSVTRELVQRIPAINVTYAADNAQFPYGTKSEPDLIARVDRVLHHLQQQTGADIIVVACNSASTIALPALRQRFDIPIVGVVPAIKPAAKISQSKVLGLLATPGTVTRQYTSDLINEFASDCQVHTLGCSELVQLAERKIAGGDVDLTTLRAQLQPLITVNQLDTLVLACTHFPLLKQELQQVLPDIKHWVDSGEAIARRVEAILNESGLSKAGLNEPGTNQLVLTGEYPSIKNLLAYLAPWFSCRYSMIAID